MANPRIDELRKRLEKEPGSRLFAQLAEELRKEGDLEEAIRVCREGLQRNPAYPSARMTLGRALFDTGDAAAARVQFEAVLKAAPDNILASRMLGESLELLGDVSGARARYELTLRMAPGDRQVKAKLEGLATPAEVAAVAPEPPPVALRPAPPPSAPPRPPAAPPAPPLAPPSFSLPPIEFAGEEVSAPEKQPAPAAVETVEPPPIRLVDVEGPMELERPYEAPTTRVVGSEPGPTGPASRRAATVRLEMPLEGDHEFELEQPYDVPTVSLRAEPTPAPVPREIEPERPAEPAEFVDFDEAPTLPGGTADFERSFDTAPPAPAAPPAPVAPPPAAAPPASVAPRAPVALPPPVALPTPAAPPPRPVRPEAVEFDEDFTAATMPWGFTTPGRSERPVSEPDTASTLIDVEPSADLVAAASAAREGARAEAAPPSPAAPAPSTVEPAAEPVVDATAEPIVEPVDEFMAEPDEFMAEADEFMAGARPEPVAEAMAEPMPALEEPIAEPAAQPQPAPQEAPESEQIASVTLAELYFSQGLPEEAAVILGRVIEREPGNQKARARLGEIQGRAVKSPPVEPGHLPGAAPGRSKDRRQEITLLLGRLEQLLAAVRKG